MPPEKTPEEKNPAEVPRENIHLHALRTYKGDVEETLSKNNVSASSIVLEEEKRRQKTLGEGGEEVAAQKTNRIFAIAGGAFLVVGLIAVVFVYVTRPTNQIVAIQKIKTAIPFSVEKNISVIARTRPDFTAEIQQQRQSFNLPVNSVLYLNAVDASGTPATSDALLELLAPRMSPSLVRSFDAPYMLGVYSFDRNAPFIILGTTDYATSYAGMLGWETDAVSDVGSLFNISPETFASSTPVFQDEAFRNEDLRVLKDGNGNTILLYSFLDKNTLLITSNENIFTAILGKYLIQKAAP